MSSVVLGKASDEFIINSITINTLHNETKSSVISTSVFLLTEQTAAPQRTLQLDGAVGANVADYSAHCMSTNISDLSQRCDFNCCYTWEEVDLQRPVME